MSYNIVLFKIVKDERIVIIIKILIKIEIFVVLI